MSSTGTRRLLTCAPMIDSETTRLLCHWYGIAYTEQDHLFGWASLLTLAHGGYGQVPLLYGQRPALSGPRAVVDTFDPLAPPERRLLPTGPAGAGVEADWSAYNATLGTAVARFSYFHLLPERELMIPIFAGPVPRVEARLTRSVYPLLGGLFKILLQLNPANADAADRYIRVVFAAMERRLADGRRFVSGDRLTLGDIAFAGALAPLLQPAGFGTRMPPIDTMPLAVRTTIQDLRHQPAADYVDRVYSSIPSANRN